jgi:hypothetical protein
VSVYTGSGRGRIDFRSTSDVGFDAPSKSQVDEMRGRFLPNFSSFSFPYPPANVSALRIEKTADVELLNNIERHVVGLLN